MHWPYELYGAVHVAVYGSVALALLLVLLQLFAVAFAAAIAVCCWWDCVYMSGFWTLQVLVCL